MHIARKAFSLPFLLAFAVASGCGTNGIGPENQLEEQNAPDNFEFQVSALDNVTDTRSYTWQNSGTAATIDISQSITAGSAMLTIRDADGTVMYEEDVAQDNDTSTPDGVAGAWTIEIDMEGVTGTFNFRVQTST